MSTYSVAEARNQLSALIERAEAGEDVVITRHGRPVVALRATGPRERRPVDPDWLRSRRAPRRPGGLDAGTLVSTMRDEDQR